MNDTIAGEMHGFLKACPLFWPPLPFSLGAVRLVPGYRPEIEADTLTACTIAFERYTILRFALPPRRVELAAAGA